MNSNAKRLTWIATLVIVLTLVLAIGVSGAWFTSRKTGSATVTMDQNVTIKLVNDYAGGVPTVEAWKTTSGILALPGDTLSDKVSIQTTTDTDSIVRINYELKMYKQGETTAITMANVDTEITDAETNAEAKRIFAYYANNAEGAANINAVLDPLTNRDQYYIYKAQTVGGQQVGWFYFSKVRESADTVDFTSEPIKIWTAITERFEHYTFEMTFTAQALQAKNINETNFATTGWGEWSDLPTEVQTLLANYTESPEDANSEVAPLTAFNYTVMDVNNTPVTTEVTLDNTYYIRLDKYIGVATSFEIADTYYVEWSDAQSKYIPAGEGGTGLAAEAGSTSLATSLDAAGIPLPVKTIGDGTQPLANNVNSVNLPTSVTTIGNEAFSSTSLSVVKAGGEVVMASAASGQTISTAPEASTWMSGVYIGYKAFVGTSISQVLIPTNVNFTINQSAFESSVKYKYNGGTYSNLNALQSAMGTKLTIDNSAMFVPTSSTGSGTTSGQQMSTYDPRGAYTSGSWTYDVVSGKAVIRTYSPSGNISSLTIPSTLGSYTVSGINSYKDGQFDSRPEYFFMSNKSLLTNSVTIPSGIMIGDFVFADCVNLRTVTISGSDIAVNTTQNCFHGCRNLTSISAPNLKTIYTSMFDGCTSLTTVSLPNVTKIEDGAFSSCSSLLSVSAPKLVSIGANAFGNCTKLNKFNSNNAGICNLYNVSVIYSGDQEQSGAFNRNGQDYELTAHNGFTKVYFSQNVYIGAFAFYDASDVTNIYFVSSSPSVALEVGSEITINESKSIQAVECSAQDYYTSTGANSDKLTVSWKNCDVFVGSEPFDGVLTPGDADITLTIRAQSGYISGIDYFANLADVTAAENTISLYSYFESNNEYPAEYQLTISQNYSQIISVNSIYKITRPNGEVDFGFNIEPNYETTNDKYNITKNLYIDDEGTVYSTATAITHDVVLSDYAATGYTVYGTYEDKFAFSAEAMNYNNYKVKFPESIQKNYSVEMQGKYIAGWTDNLNEPNAANAHTYMFNDENGTEFNLSYLSDGITDDCLPIFYPIWADANFTVELDDGPNAVAYDENTLVYQYNGFVLPQITGEGCWEKVLSAESDVRYIYNGFVCLDSSERTGVYTFKATLEQSERLVATNVSVLLGYDGDVINVKDYVFETAPSTEKINFVERISYNNEQYSYSLPTLNNINGYKFQGWIASIDTVVNGESIPAGTLITGADKNVTTFGAVEWTANWKNEYTIYFSDYNGRFDYIFNAPFKGDNDNGSRLCEIVANEENNFSITLPIDHNSGYTFDGWYCNGEFVGAGESILQNITTDMKLVSHWTQGGSGVVTWLDDYRANFGEAFTNSDDRYSAYSEKFKTLFGNDMYTFDNVVSFYGGVLRCKTVGDYDYVTAETNEHTLWIMYYQKAATAENATIIALEMCNNSQRNGSYDFRGTGSYQRFADLSAAGLEDLLSNGGGSEPSYWIDDYRANFGEVFTNSDDRYSAYSLKFNALYNQGEMFTFDGVVYGLSGVLRCKTVGEYDYVTAEIASQQTLWIIYYHRADDASNATCLAIEVNGNASRTDGCIFTGSTGYNSFADLSAAGLEDLLSNGGGSEPGGEVWYNAYIPNFGDEFTTNNPRFIKYDQKLSQVITQVSSPLSVGEVRCRTIGDYDYVTLANANNLFIAYYHRNGDLDSTAIAAVEMFSGSAERSGESYRLLSGSIVELDDLFTCGPEPEPTTWIDEYVGNFGEEFTNGDERFEAYSDGLGRLCPGYNFEDVINSGATLRCVTIGSIDYVTAVAGGTLYIVYYKNGGETTTPELAFELVCEPTRTTDYQFVSVRVEGAPVYENYSAFLANEEELFIFNLLAH